MKKIIVKPDIPESLIEVPSKRTMPELWDQLPVSISSQKYGDDWLNEGIHPVFKIPSVIVPVEINYVINPLHDHFYKVEIGHAEVLPVDARFLITNI